ncbi:NUDIX domain-containing protein [Candidatus Pacearchaeota archaeon]|nr:NUDIX domain-containing protein [Candidatus Pacearchaeota archaeon]
MAEIEKKILRLFTEKEKLKFSEIEKLLKIRSNKLAYYLKNLIKKGILEKQNENYRLTETAENLIPYFSEKTSPLPVILIRIGNNKNCFLCKREKRPFRDKLSLPGGRLLVNESIKEAVKRIMKEKYNINAELSKIISVSLEIVKRKSKKMHSFILILVEAMTKNKVKLESAAKNRKNIISSDYKLIASKPKEIKIENFYTKV